KPNGVGHHLPTGDVFRRIILEVAQVDQSHYTKVATFGRVFKTVKDPTTGNTIQKLVSDSTLDPFEERLIKVQMKGPLRYRVQYHFTSEFLESRSKLNSEDLTLTLLSGVTN